MQSMHTSYIQLCRTYTATAKAIVQQLCAMADVCVALYCKEIPVVSFQMSTAYGRLHDEWSNVVHLELPTHVRVNLAGQFHCQWRGTGEQAARCCSLYGTVAKTTERDSL
jgi:hypothetical protein